jgi:uncharacterized membrane protein YkvI
MKRTFRAEEGIFFFMAIIIISIIIIIIPSSSLSSAEHVNRSVLEHQAVFLVFLGPRLPVVHNIVTFMSDYKRGLDW